MSNTNPEHPARLNVPDLPASCERCACRGIPRLLNSQEVADILGITKRQVERLRQNGKLGSVPITGAAARHRPEQVEAFIRANSRDV